MSINELQNKVNELRSLRRMAAELEAEMETITDSIKSHMNSQGIDELMGNDYKITWKPVQSKRFDKEQMIKAFGQDCYDEFCKVTTNRRFTINV